MVGPSSIPFERWTSTLTLLSVALVVFSTVPVNALVAESYDRTSRAPARTSSKGFCQNSEREQGSIV